jgi:hypothetical protein
VAARDTVPDRHSNPAHREIVIVGERPSDRRTCRGISRDLDTLTLEAPFEARIGSAEATTRGKSNCILQLSDPFASLEVFLADCRAGVPERGRNRRTDRPVGGVLGTVPLAIGMFSLLVVRARPVDARAAVSHSARGQLGSIKRHGNCTGSLDGSLVIRVRSHSDATGPGIARNAGIRFAASRSRARALRLCGRRRSELSLAFDQGAPRCYSRSS